MTNIFHGTLHCQTPTAKTPTELSQNAAVAVIMAGGSGTRFWPMSRTSFPKQFLPLGPDADSLIQATARRVEPLVGPQGVLVVTAAHQQQLVVQQLPQAAVLSEPQARNTAACVGFAAHKVLSTVGDVPMICLPADHVVLGQDKILEVYAQGVELAAKHDVLVTIGISPRSPETGYGYIERSAEQFAGGPGYNVQRFVEKPDRETAESYLESGNYYWNSGMFIWRPSVVLAAIQRFLPELSDKLEQIAAKFGSVGEFQAVAELYATLVSVSVDVGIMERAPNTVMLPGDSFVWSDVGSWSSWSDTIRESSGDASGNIITGDVVLLGSTGCSVVSAKPSASSEMSAAQASSLGANPGRANTEKPRLIAGIGLKDLVIVDTPDAILICPQDKSQEVKEIVQFLAKAGRNDLL